MAPKVDLRVRPLTEKLISRKRLVDRAVDELVGLAKGLTADDSINQDEAVFLHDWLDKNKNYIHKWPFYVIYQRVSEMLQDRDLDDQESRELLAILVNFANRIKYWETEEYYPNDLPFNIPEPIITFPGKFFCFTGICWSMKRSHCKEIVETFGGKFTDTVSKQVDYLVVGMLGNKLWSHSSFGRKIEEAKKINQEGYNIFIVSEKNWYETIHSWLIEKDGYRQDVLPFAP